jgi:hypothetical protein
MQTGPGVIEVEEGREDLRAAAQPDILELKWTPALETLRRAAILMLL